MERMREEPAPPAWRAESRAATAGDGSHAHGGRTRPKTAFTQVLENFRGDAEDTQTSVFASEAAD